MPTSKFNLTTAARSTIALGWPAVILGSAIGAWYITDWLLMGDFEPLGLVIIPIFLILVVIGSSLISLSASLLSALAQREQSPNTSKVDRKGFFIRLMIFPYRNTRDYLVSRSVFLVILLPTFMGMVISKWLFRDVLTWATLVGLLSSLFLSISIRLYRSRRRLQSVI